MKITKISSAAGAAALVLGGAATAQDLLVAEGEGPFHWDSYRAFADAHDLSGQTLTITGASTGADKDKLENTFAYFAAATGAEVQLSGSDSFEQDIVISVEAGSPPDIAMFPQPGLAGDLAGQGALVELDPDNRA